MFCSVHSSNLIHTFCILTECFAQSAALIWSTLLQMATPPWWQEVLLATWHSGTWRPGLWEARHWRLMGRLSVAFGVCPQSPSWSHHREITHLRLEGFFGRDEGHDIGRWLTEGQRAFGRVGDTGCIWPLPGLGLEILFCFKKIKINETCKLWFLIFYRVANVWQKIGNIIPVACPIWSQFWCFFWFCTISLCCSLWTTLGLGQCLDPGLFASLFFFFCFFLSLSVTFERCHTLGMDMGQCFTEWPSAQ